jgi:molecular chaperone DnaK (HSP70)
VKAVAWDEFLGGHDFDVKLAGVFGKQFDEKNQVTPTRLCFCVLLLQQ